MDAKYTQRWCQIQIRVQNKVHITTNETSPSPPPKPLRGQTQMNSATSLSINLFPILVWHPFKFVFQSNIQLLLDQGIHNFALPLAKVIHSIKFFYFKFGIRNHRLYRQRFYRRLCQSFPRGIHRRFCKGII